MAFSHFGQEPPVSPMPDEVVQTSPEAAEDLKGPAADLVILSLGLLAQLRRSGNRAFAAVGLTYGQAMLLMFVSQGFTRPKDLSELLGLVFPALSALVTHLVEADLMQRTFDPEDGRRVELRLTPAGAEMCLKVRQAWLEAHPLELRGLSEVQIEMLTELLRVTTQAKSP